VILRVSRQAHDAPDLPAKAPHQGRVILWVGHRKLVRHHVALQMPEPDLLLCSHGIASRVWCIEKEKEVELAGAHEGEDRSWLLFIGYHARHERILEIHEREQSLASDEHSNIVIVLPGREFRRANRDKGGEYVRIVLV